MGAGVYFAKEHCSYNYCLASILRAYGELCFIDILHKPSSFFLHGYAQKRHTYGQKLHEYQL
jgi:hypothetical protein